MIQMLQEGFPIEPMVNFMENLYKNPSHRAVTELYGFLEKNALPITPDGHFLAYKKVRTNYLDVHSGTMDNSIGKIVEMERHEVNDNKDETCSTGLHFCGMSYLSCFGGERTVIVKINPADVVSIPSDYNDAKGRACRYEVIGEVDADKANQAFTRPVQSNSSNYDVPVQTGDSPFKAGYTAGYRGGYDALDEYYGKDRLNYREGYEKGTQHAREGIPERYRYVTVHKTSTGGFASYGHWPNPV
jgi:hypothetical protein